MVELHRRWVEALRSGTYRQCFIMYGTRDGCRCALGVALDLLPGVEWVATPGEDEVRPVGLTTYAWLGQRLGLDVWQVRAVAHWNDVDQLPLPAIADKAEAMLSQP